jgi:NAD(P)H-flavin reductase
MGNVYKPQLMTIETVVQETQDVKTFRMRFVDGESGGLRFQPGQFGMFSVFGQGEAPFGLANAPTRNAYVECSVKRVGKVTRAFHLLNPGDVVGFRGPYGRGFPLEEMRGKNLLLVGGGIGMAPLRSLLWNCVDRRRDFAEITLLYGATSESELLYRAELEEWSKRDDICAVLTVDPGGERGGWTGEVGLVPNVLDRLGPSPRNTAAIVCGPSMMIRFVLLSLTHLGFTPDQIMITLEAKIKCGVGKCGRCNIGPSYVCKHGPVFSYAELERLPEDY